MVDEAKYASCPYCGEVVFHYFDRKPEVDCPDLVFECCECLNQLKRDELEGIVWIEVDFRCQR